MRDEGGARDSVSGIAGATAFAAAAALLLVEAAAALGARAGWWDFRAGFTALRTCAYLGLASAGLGFYAMVSRIRERRGGGARLAAASVALSLAVFAIPASYLWTARHVPMIHDITTDTEDPPAFEALLEIRKRAPNGAEYGGEETARKQREAYPDIRPVDLEVGPSAAFDRALAAARGLGWEVAAADRGKGRIEATDTTRWFGFRDDVVIRISPAAGGRSRVDVRSASRVGKSDIGKNAARIRAFVRALGEP